MDMILKRRKLKVGRSSSHIIRGLFVISVLVVNLQLSIVVCYLFL